MHDDPHNEAEAPAAGQANGSGPASVEAAVGSEASSFHVRCERGIAIGTIALTRPGCRESTQQRSPRKTASSILPRRAGMP